MKKKQLANSWPEANDGNDGTDRPFESLSTSVNSVRLSHYKTCMQNVLLELPIQGNGHHAKLSDQFYSIHLAMGNFVCNSKINSTAVFVNFMASNNQIKRVIHKGPLFSLIHSQYCTSIGTRFPRRTKNDRI